MLDECHPLVLKNIQKTYGNSLVLNGLNFELRKGEILGLLGPNGSGKSTTIKILMTLEKPTSGSISIFGKDYTQMQMVVKSTIGYVPQELVYYNFFTVLELLKLISAQYGLKKNHEKIEELLFHFQLEEVAHKKIILLSGGQKRRVMIARALLHSPSILLLDEPTAGVDIDLKWQLHDLIGQLKKQGLSILLTTHYLDEAEKLCDRIAFLHKGRIVLVDDKKNILENFSSRELTITHNASLPKIHHPKLALQQDQKLIFSLSHATSWLSIIREIGLSEDNILDFFIQEASLEEAYQRVFDTKS